MSATARTLNRIFILCGVLGLMLAGPMLVEAQDPGRQQQMMRMQEQMQQMNRVMDRVAGIQERARNMEQQMVQSMARLQENRELAAQDATRLRNQERLRSMAQATGDGAQEMRRAMEQLRNMMGEPGAGWDAEMQREMERLRQHWEGVADGMEEGLQIMDRIRDRIHQPG